MNPNHLIVETYKCKPDDFLNQLTEDYKQAIVALYLEMKSDSSDSSLKEKREKALDRLDKDTSKLAAEAVQLKKDAEYTRMGFCWRVRLKLNGDVVFHSPMACRTQHDAQRKGNRYIERYRKTGDFETRLGVQAVAK